jgi:hypothetical protein
VPSFAPSARQAVSFTAVALSLGWGLMSDDSFSALAKVFGGGPTTSVSTSRPQVGVIVDAPTAMAADVARELRRDGAAASVALSGSVDRSTLAAIRTSGSDALPRLKPGGPVRWVGTRSQVKRLARAFGVTGHIYYSVPAHGYTYTQSLLAHTAGASAVRGQVQLASSDALKHVDRGDIIELGVDGADWRVRLRAVCEQLRLAKLRAVPADQLLRGE